MLTGVQKKFSSLAAFRDVASEHGADHLLDTLQRETGRLFQMGEDIRSGAHSPDVKFEMLNSFLQEQAKTFCKDSASVVDFFGVLVNQSPEHWHRSITVSLMIEERLIGRMHASLRILNTAERVSGKKIHRDVCETPQLFSKSQERLLLFEIVKDKLNQNPLMFLMGRSFASAAILGSQLFLPTLSVNEKVMCHLFPRNIITFYLMTPSFPVRTNGVVYGLLL